MQRKAYIQVYTGQGKGKTTAALGLALRAVCADLKVYMGQFFKGQDYAELKAAQLLRGFSMEQYGLVHFIKGKPKSEDYQAAKTGFERAKEALHSQSFDLIILDEINTALSLGLLDEDEVLAMMDNKPDNVELVLTGRGASQKIMDKADLVTEMKEIKHYYQNGVMARKGIEY